MPSDQSILELLKSYSDEFNSQLRRINTFVKHPAAIGTSHEGILRRFLQRYTPKRMAVSEGFIIGELNTVSNQCDIIIWSHLDYSPIYQEGDFVIVPAEAVKAVIEVKTTLNKNNLDSAFCNLNSVYTISDQIYTAIFAFESIEAQTILKHVIELDQNLSKAVYSIYGMSGWHLQRSKDIKFEKYTVMETRPKKLAQYEDLLPFTLILLPKENTSARGLTQFLAFLYSSLYLNSPIKNIPGGKLHGFVFPGYGVKFFTDVFTCDDEADEFLKESDLSKYLKYVEEHMESLQVSQE